MAVAIVPTVIYSGMLGVVVLALVGATTQSKSQQSKYLIGLLLLLTIHIFGELFIYSGAYEYAPGLAGFQLPIRMLLGPALYFYAYAAMSPNNKLSIGSYLLALSGPLIVLMLMIPFIFNMSPAQKLALADPATRDPELWKIALYTCLASAIAFIAFTFAYLIAAFKVQSKYRRQLLDKYSEIEQRSMDWFKVVLILWGSAWLIYTANYTASFLGIRFWGIGAVLPIFELIILVIFTHLAINQVTVGVSERGEPEPPKERPTIISTERMRQVAENLASVMVERELFKNEDLSLSALSKSISVSENHISETLSQFMQTNFFQFVNSYRVDEAKKLLNSSDMLVTSIAYEVGFKSKSTFNSAFKKMVGTTPTAFKTQNSLESKQ